jgi:hypothetical protein
MRYCAHSPEVGPLPPRWEGALGATRLARVAPVRVGGPGILSNAGFPPVPWRYPCRPGGSPPREPRHSPPRSPVPQPAASGPDIGAITPIPPRDDASITALPAKNA